MVEEPLVGAERLSAARKAVGRTLLDRMDELSARVSDAFWTYLDEEGVWRLVLATHLAESEGPLHVYRMLQGALSELGEDSGLELSDIAVISPNSLAVDQLRQQYGEVEHEDERRVRRTTGPFIYRLSAA